MTAVVTILMVLAAVVYPKFAALQRGQSSRDFRSALADLAAEARVTAIETGRIVQVTYQDDRRAIVTNSVDPDNFELSEIRSLPLLFGTELTSFTVEGLYASAGDWMIEFHPDGTGNDAGIEVDEAGRTSSFEYRGEDGSSHESATPLEESANREWEAGEIESRI